MSLTQASTDPMDFTATPPVASIRTGGFCSEKKVDKKKKRPVQAASSIVAGVCSGQQFLDCMLHEDNAFRFSLLCVAATEAPLVRI